MISLNQIRTAIRSKYYIPDLTIRAQGDLVGASHQTMMRINKRCDNSNINHPIAETLSDSELIQKLYPHNKCPVSHKRPPDTEEIVCELTKARGKRKTRTVLYLEYVAIDPATALSRTHF